MDEREGNWVRVGCMLLDFGNNSILDVGRDRADLEDCCKQALIKSRAKCLVCFSRGLRHVGRCKTRLGRVSW